MFLSHVSAVIVSVVILQHVSAVIVLSWWCQQCFCHVSAVIVSVVSFSPCQCCYCVSSEFSPCQCCYCVVRVV